MRVLLSPIFFVIRLLWQTVFLALGQVWANKIRAVLTALGIIIGVVGVTGVGTMLNAMESFVLDQFEGIGAKKMWVWGQVPESKRSVMSWTDAKLSTYEANLILEHATQIDTLTPGCRASWEVTNGKKVLQGVRVTGIWPSWHEIEDRQVLFGRPFSRIDDAENRQVCLINEQGIEELNLDTDPVGDYILVDGRRFLIIGIIETKEVSPMMGGGEARTELYIPFSTHKMMNPYTWTDFTLQMVDPEKAEDAKAEIRFILRNHRGLDPDDEDTFDMFVIQSAIEDFNSVARVIALVLVGVVFISLIVGGVGIMNIMLVSVSERTREIGLRKAMGAKPPVVLMQFLVEAVVLCLSGGLIGLLIVQALVTLVPLIPDFPFDSLKIPTWAILLSVSFSAAVGIFSESNGKSGM
ncbi:MAG TPA: FtsX-like permease family protein, partial [Phycisphaerales bacterium]|nr:FtsX-like permease family protein [Phycisphaerales bacterium]